MAFLNEISNLFNVLFKGDIQKSENKTTDDESSIFSDFSQKESKIDNQNVDQDYVQSYDDISEQLFINKQVKRNEEFSEKWQNELISTLSNADISDELKNELSSLYNSLINSGDQAKKDRINAQIMHLFAEEERKNNNDLEALYYNLTLSATRVMEGNDLKGLYEQLSECVSQNQKFVFQNEIEKKRSAYQAEESKNFIQSYIYQQDLPKNVKDTLSSLYSDLLDAPYKEQREQIEAQIHLFYSQNGIDKNSELALGLNYNAVISMKNQEITELYEQLSEAYSQNTRDYILCKIETVKSEYDSEIESYSQQMIINDLNIQNEAKSQILGLISEMSNTDSPQKIDALSASISQIMQEAGVDNQSSAYINFNNSVKNLQMNKELKLLYQELSEADSNEQRAELNKEIRDVLEKYNFELS